MKAGCFIAVFVAFAVYDTFGAVQIREALSEADLSGFKSVFNAALTKMADVQTVFYAANGFSLLKEKIPNSQVSENS